MITKSSFTVILMMTLDYTSLEECEAVSRHMYNENRCFESNYTFAKVPIRKPSILTELIYEYQKDPLTHPQ